MKFLFTSLFTLFTFSLLAQNTYTLGGKLKDEATKEPIVGATVFVSTPDSTIAAGTVTDSKGAFSVDLKKGHYKIKISYLGMEPYIEEIRFYRGDYLGTIYMKPATNELKGVNVKRKAAVATVEGDTTSFNAKAYKTNQNASAKDLLEKMPGVQDDNGEIKAQGEKVQQVLVDGKQFFGQ
ncbi:MAG: carboxypeptidase-like regulatory domain-containing protein, partial [Bacteroidia bacterium]